MKKIVLDKEPSLVPRLDAFPYQTEAFLAVKDLSYSAIFHEQGLGKTKIAVDLLLYWISQKEIDTVLIVTKKQLVQNWVNEFKNHTHIKPSILNSNRKDNYYVFNGPSRVVITNFEVLVLEFKRFCLYLKARNVAIIIDESAKLKNPNSKLTNAYFELSNLFKIRTIMTGTPVANRPFDIWAQIFFLDQGKSLGTDFEEFKKETNLSNDLIHSEIMQSGFEGAISNIFNKIRHFTVREIKKSGIIDLPEKIIKTIPAHFEFDQKILYEKIISEIDILVQKNDKVFVEQSKDLLKKILRLIQIASNPKLIDELYGNESGKEKALDGLIEQIMTSGEKCIVWSSFIENIDFFASKYKSLGATKIHGRMNISERNRSVTNFNDDDCRILFATPQSAKEGLTLTVANHVIFYDRNLSLDDYLQAQDRIHRISQKKTCYVYNIIMQDSIDLWVNALLEAKQKAALLTQGDITREEYIKDIDYSFGEMLKSILVQ